MCAFACACACARGCACACACACVCARMRAGWRDSQTLAHLPRGRAISPLPQIIGRIGSRLDFAPRNSSLPLAFSLSILPFGCSSSDSLDSSEGAPDLRIPCADPVLRQGIPSPGKLTELGCRTLLLPARCRHPSDFRFFTAGRYPPGKPSFSHAGLTIQSLSCLGLSCDLRMSDLQSCDNGNPVNKKLGI